MRLAINPADRVHMLVWKGRGDWLAAPSINGCPINFGQRFDTWSEAMEYALGEVDR